MLWFKSERPWFNLEAGTSFFEGDSAFQFLNLSKTTRFYGFVSWYGPIPIECVLY